MNEGRIKRANRVVEIRRRAVEDAQRKLASANLDVREARSVVRNLEHAWEEQAAIAMTASAIQVGEFSEIHAHLSVLRERLNRAELRFNEAVADEESRHKELCESRLELRKIELWRDHLTEDSLSQLALLERKENDTAALRAHARKSS